MLCAFTEFTMFPVRSNMVFVGKNLTTMGEAMPNIVEVELNTYMLRYERNLAAFHATLAGRFAKGETSLLSASQAAEAAEAATRYAMAAQDRAAAMDALMWNETTQRWHDLFFDWSMNASTSSSSVASTPRQARQLLRLFNSSSSFLPLWAGAASTHVPSRVAQAAQALIGGDLWRSGGVVSTTANGTGELLLFLTGCTAL